MEQFNDSTQAYIDNIKNRCQRLHPIVAIECITYNHESFIRDALDGFVMQQTNFTFVAIVHDDASTDKTADIMREYAAKYPDIIMPIYESENLYSKRDGSLDKVLRESKKATGAKYVAYCEGDDYWTDPLKLQKQVDYMESHPDCSMCFTNVTMHWEDKRELDKVRFTINENKQYTGKDILVKPPLQTATILVKAEIYFSELYKKAMKGAVCGDNVLFQTAAYYGYLHGFSSPMAVYRLHPGGVTNIVFDNPDYIFKFLRQHERKPILYGKELRPEIEKLVCSRYFIYMMKFFSERNYKVAAKCLYRSFSFSFIQTLKEIRKYLKYKFKQLRIES